MIVCEIQSHLEEMYGVEVSPTLISSVTDAVVGEVNAWQAHPLDTLHPNVGLCRMQLEMICNHILGNTVDCGS